MPTYITLIEYTQRGIEHIDQSPERLEAAREVAESFGGEIKEFYLTMGRYDAVVVTEFPDEEAAARAVLTIASEGAVSTETMTAFAEDDYRDLVASLS